MKASETKLQQIIEGTKQYVVPLFQRSYSWDRKEWQILLDDIIDLCNEIKPRNHFIGSIVTMPTSSVPEGVAKFLLIDGQQRLTTIFILMTLLRDIARKNNKGELAEEINHTLLVNPFKKELDYFKLLPTQIDRSTFQSLIIRTEEKEDNSLNESIKDQVSNAYCYFERELKLRRVDVEKLTKVISNQLSLVSIVLDSDDDPYLVFESLNAKGRLLTQADLIRNFFFMKVHVNEHSYIYEKYWKPMQDALGVNLTEFIRHYLSKDGVVIKQNEVYFSLKELVNNGKEDAIYHLMDLFRFAQFYQKILYPGLEKDKKIQERLIRLNRIEVTTAYPFLLHCYNDYFEGKLGPLEFVNVLFIIENYILRRFVSNINTNDLNKIFPFLYTQINNLMDGTFQSRLCRVLQNKGYPKDQEFRRWLKDARLYGQGDRARRTKLILESIEESFGHKEVSKFDDLTIEHIMPQTLTSAWKQYLGNEWEITHELLKHTIGNLTLTGYNSELSNSEFKVKKLELSKSHLELNKYFEKLGSWNREDIEQRSDYLADITLTIWPYFGIDKDQLNENTIVTGTTPITLWLLGQYFKVKSWRDVLVKTLETIAELEPEKFEEIVYQYPNLIGTDKSKFREIRLLNNGLYIEVNLAAQYIQKLCNQLIQFVELTSEDWRVEVA